MAHTVPPRGVASSSWGPGYGLLPVSPGDLDRRLSRPATGRERASPIPLPPHILE